MKEDIEFYMVVKIPREVTLLKVQFEISFASYPVVAYNSLMNEISKLILLAIRASIPIVTNGSNLLANTFMW